MKADGAGPPATPPPLPNPPPSPFSLFPPHSHNAVQCMVISQKRVVKPGNRTRIPYIGVSVLPQTVVTSSTAHISVLSAVAVCLHKTTFLTERLEKCFVLKENAS